MNIKISSYNKIRMGDAIDLLRKYVDKMDNPYNNKKLSKQIYGRIQESKKESESIAPRRPSNFGISLLYSPSPNKFVKIVKAVP